jgi:hypothetical protein
LEQNPGEMAAQCPEPHDADARVHRPGLDGNVPDALALLTGEAVEVAMDPDGVEGAELRHRFGHAGIDDAPDANILADFGGKEVLDAGAGREHRFQFPEGSK